MQTQPRQRKTNPKRAALWVFEKLETLRNRMVRRAGRLNRAAGALTLTLSTNEAVQENYEMVMRGLKKAA